MENSLTIISNNDLVLNKFSNSIKVNGDYLDILIKTRDLIHSGYKLVTYPNNASIRMLFSPVKSIVLSKLDKGVDLSSVDIIEKSIIQLNNTLGIRKADFVNKEDYKILDYELFISALEEIKIFNNME